MKTATNHFSQTLLSHVLPILNLGGSDTKIWNMGTAREGGGAGTDGRLVKVVRCRNT